MVQINQNLVINTFYRVCKRPTFKKSTSTYVAECPYCHEGSSAGKKRRFFYIPAKDQLYCHNCSINRNGFNFVKELTDMSVAEILSESDNQADTVDELIKKSEIYKKLNPNSLPDDSINLFDASQVDFYKNNKVVKDALDFIKKRRLDTAVNKPKALWLSLTDYTHKNRVIFPFYSKGAKIEFYQSRALYKEDADRAKYLSKANSDKFVFNISLVSPDLEYIFLQEGPIDAMFLRNSVALAGIHPTEEQLEIITNLYPLHNLIYVLDNQWVDSTSHEVTKKLLNAGNTVFIWPEKLKEFKDLNDLCVYLKKDEIKPEFIIKHSFLGMKGLLEYSHIKCKQN